jgi:D-inositol-3-phosphate glycosyltransferase
MVFGVAIVATSVFGLPELLTNGKTGFLFEPRRMSALQGALHRVLRLHSLDLNEVAEAGRHHARENYDSHGYATEIPAILQGLLAHPDRAPADFLHRHDRVT